MSYKKTKLSKNFIAKDDALNKYYTFDEFCTNFDDYKGKELGRGSFGTASILKNMEKFFGDREVVVKEIKVRHSNIQNECYENVNIEIGRKKDKPQQLKNVFFCQGENLVLSEYYISLIASQLNSVNFIDTYVYKDCTEDKVPKSQFIFMEKIDKTFHEVVYKDFFRKIRALNEQFEDLMQLFTKSQTEDLDEKIRKKAQELENYYRKFDVLIIQILHALWCLHAAGINHNDCKSDNIFCVSKSNYVVTHTKKKLSDYKYVEYDFTSGGEGKKIYIPVEDIEYVIKVGDFGLSQKFSPPAILTSYIDQPWQLDFLCPFYDLMLAFSIIDESASLFYNSIQADLVGLGKSVDFMNNKVDVDEFIKKWEGELCHKCDQECNITKGINFLINQGTDETKQLLAESINENFDAICETLMVNDKDANKDRRQHYNFLMSEMKNSKHTVDTIINSKYFNTRMSQLKQYGWKIGSIESDQSVLSFGGPGVRENKPVVYNKYNIADDSDGDSDTSDSSDSDSDGVSDLTDTESVDSFHSSRSNTRSGSSPYQIFQLEMTPRASKRR